MELKTPLYQKHLEAGGKIVPFAGYLLPVQYGTGVIAEHMAVRTSAGLFDVSHMGEITLAGPDALANINYLVTNDCTDMVDGQVRYSPMCYENGGVVDDLMVYRCRQDRYLLVVNASNRHKDARWIEEHLTGEVEFKDISDTIAQIALQGPKSYDILKKLCNEGDIPAKYYYFKQDVSVHIPGGVAGDGPIAVFSSDGTAAAPKPDVITCVVSKTGYTGEDGYELYCANEDAPLLWQALLEAGEEYGLIPCGLGARDTLRLEAAMPLYGHEMDENITPVETGLGYFVKLNKDDFIGKHALVAKGEPTQKRVGLKMTGRGIAREECPVWLEDRQIGITTSGTHCPYLNHAVAMAMVKVPYSAVGTEVEVEVRGRKIAAEIVKLPFYKKGQPQEK